VPVWTAHKVSPLPGLDPHTIQPIPSSCINYAILATHCVRTSRKVLCPTLSATYSMLLESVNLKEENFSVSADNTYVE
jgi:hypothetical protein